MIFEAIHHSAQRGELILVDGGYCRWHLRRDKQLTILEIISLRRGAGQEMLSNLKVIPSAKIILARCPADLPSNDWWRKRGFTLIKTETTRTGRTINVWVLRL